MADEEELKIWLAVRTDLVMPRGKLATQAGHGYAGALYQAVRETPDVARAYMCSGGMAKITVATSSEATLERIFRTAIETGINAYIVRDAGRTVFAEPTLTVCAFGPCKKSDLPPYLNRLRLLKDEE